MEISGFKSFRDRVELAFPDGVTAIVGPNGCGKSNIGDAINWVLGEQSARMLRGQQMADVIFNGSEARKALGMAEVGLVFAGADGLPHADGGRVVIARRLYRSGESEYRLNGARARLKDVQDLLREAKVGARTYATIEQGKIDQVLNAKPKDRRALIEDAAGISGYKHKRRLAEIKLEATQANLLRVQDIAAEVVRQINSLKRQAAKARRYRRLREELRERELLRFVLRQARLAAELAAAERQEADARAVEVEAAARQSRLAAELAREREELDRAAQGLRAAAEDVHQLDLAIDRQEQGLRAGRERVAEAQGALERQGQERADVERRRGEVAGELAAGATAIDEHQAALAQVERDLTAEREALDRARGEQDALRGAVDGLRAEQFRAMGRVVETTNRARSIDELLERATAQRVRLTAERVGVEDDLTRTAAEAAEITARFAREQAEVLALRQRFEEQQARLQQRRQELDAEVAALAAAREREQSALARLATLEDLETRFAGADGVRSLLAHGAASGIRTHGVVADYVEAAQEFESAAEGYLQAILPAVVVEDDADTGRAARFLREQGAGRTWLVARDHPAGGPAVGQAGNGRGVLPADLAADPRVLGRLRDRLTLKASANGVVADRIGDALLVDTLETALELHRRHAAVDYLTPDGDVVYASGVVSSGGRPAFGKGLLSHKRRTEQARAEAGAVAGQTAELLSAVERLREEVLRLEAAIDAGRLTLAERERGVVELEHRARLFDGERERGGRRVEVLAEELEAACAEIARLEGERAAAVAEVQAAEGQAATCAAELAARGAALAGIEQGLREREGRLGELRVAAAERRQRLEALTAQRERLGAAERELIARGAQLAAEAAATVERLGDTARQIAEIERDHARDLALREAAAERKQEAEREIADRRAELAGKEQALEATGRELAAGRERVREHELERARAEAARGHLDDLCRQELGVTAEEAARSVSAAAPAGADDAATDLPAVEEQAAELRRRIDELGPVNLTAIDEFSELEARHGFLAAQREDLERSIESLRETIRRINRQSRERFSAAFEQIRLSYQEVFRALFSGGRADLRLEEDEDVLECGIEILAQPPGKRLASVQLMSGGEKALSAIALLFAIFRYQPSPFCLLDEVDAALDDSNVGRFARMIGEYARNTQFVVITHNKLSMEAANLMYGVTMEEAGVSKVVSLQLA